MSIGTTPFSNALIPPFPVRPFSVDEYHRLIDAGVLTEDDNVELLEGWIVPKMPRDPPHDAILDQAQEALRHHLPSSWRVRVQSAITTMDSVPEPDIALAPGPASRYRNSHPSSQEVALAVEVADTTLAHDRTAKARIYARAGILTYWIVNIPDSLIEVYTDPTGPGASPHYQSRQDYRLGDTVPLTLPGEREVFVLVASILG